MFFYLFLMLIFCFSDIIQKLLFLNIPIFSIFLKFCLQLLLLGKVIPIDFGLLYAIYVFILVVDHMYQRVQTFILPAHVLLVHTGHSDLIIGSDLLLHGIWLPCKLDFDLNLFILLFFHSFNCFQCRIESGDLALFLLSFLVFLSIHFAQGHFFFLRFLILVIIFDLIIILFFNFLNLQLWLFLSLFVDRILIHLHQVPEIVCFFLSLL